MDGDPTPKTTAEFTEVTGFVEGTYVRFWNASGDLLKRVQIVSINTTTNVVTFATDALDFDATAGWRITGENFGAIAESATKPFGWAEVQMATAALKTIPTMLGVTEQLISSVPGLNAWIEGKLRMRAVRNLSWHLLKGDGTQADQLAGFDNESGAQSYAWSGGETGDNRLDAVIRAMAMIPWTGDLAVVLNKLDLIKMLIVKGSDGHYINSNMLGSLSVISVGNRLFLGPFEMILDDAVVEGDFYALNLSEASELVDAQTNTLTYGYINDQFARNQITARYEERLLHEIQTVRAFVLGEWDSAPT